MAEGTDTADLPALRLELATLRAELARAAQEVEHARAAADAARALNQALLANDFTPAAPDVPRAAEPPAAAEPAEVAEVAELRAKAAHLDAILASRTWRLAAGPRRVYARLRGLGGRGQ